MVHSRKRDMHKIWGVKKFFVYKRVGGYILGVGYFCSGVFGYIVYMC